MGPPLLNHPITKKHGSGPSGRRNLPFEVEQCDPRARWRVEKEPLLCKGQQRLRERRFVNSYFVGD